MLGINRPLSENNLRALWHHYEYQKDSRWTNRTSYSLCNLWLSRNSSATATGVSWPMQCIFRQKIFCHLWSWRMICGVLPFFSHTVQKFRFALMGIKGFLAFLWNRSLFITLWTKFASFSLWGWLLCASGFLPSKVGQCCKCKTDTFS